MTPKLLVSPRLFPTIVGSLHLSPYPLPSLALTSSFHVLVLVLHALLRSRSQFVSSPFLFPFLASSSFHLRFPVPKPQVCSIAGSRPSLVYLFRMVFCFGRVFPVETVRFCFPQLSLLLLSPSFRPVIPTSVLLLSSRPQGVPTLPRLSFDLRFYRPFSGARFLWPAGSA